MKSTVRLIPFVAAFAWFAALPASAAQGNVNAIQLYDLNHDGKIERAVLTVDNPLLRTWRVNGTSGLKVRYGAAELRVAHVFVTTTSRDELAKIEVVWDEADAALPIDTSGARFEVEYAPSAIGLGIDDGTDSLSVISSGDASAGDTEIDRASPLLVSSSPAPATTGTARDQGIALAFSEPIVTTSLAYLSDPDAAGWTASWASDARSVMLDHAKYGSGAQVTFTVTVANDPTGNGLVPGALTLNPFTFGNTSTAVSNPNVQPIYRLNEPRAGTSLQSGVPVLIAWYSNQPEIASTRVSYAPVDGSYATIGTYPASKRSTLWTPPNAPGTYNLRIEGLTAGGALYAIETLSSFTIVTPPEKSRLLVLAAPAVSGVGETSAAVSVGLSANPQSVELYCNGPKRPEPALFSGDRPVMVSVALAGLTKNTIYDCSFRLVDAFGAATTVSVPQFGATSGGADTKAPVLGGSPKISDFDYAKGAAKLTIMTDEAVTLSVEYGQTPHLTSTALSATPGTTHVLALAGMVASAKYRYRVTMTDAAGNVTTSGDLYFIALREGDRIKGSGAAVYWYLNGKRYVFASETIYRSWFADFLNVLPIPDEQLSGIAIGGNAQMHSGTWMVKIQSDPKTYAVEPGGILRWIQSEAHAKSLFGAEWNRRVRDIDVSLFTDFTIGEPLPAGQFPEGYLARTADGRSWYVGQDIRRFELTNDGLESNHYVAARYDASFLPPADETSNAWTRLLSGEAIGATDPRLNVVRLTPGGAKIYAP